MSRCSTRNPVCAACGDVEAKIADGQITVRSFGFGGSAPAEQGCFGVAIDGGCDPVCCLRD